MSKSINLLRNVKKNKVVQLTEMNKTVLNLKMEIEILKKTQTEGTLKMQNLGKAAGITNDSITNRMQEMKDKILGIEDLVEEIDSS